MKYLSTFSGIGGFELGIQQAYESTKNLQTLSESRQFRDKSNGTISDNRHLYKQASCIGFSEIDKYAIQVYEKHFNHKNYGDITTINEKELPDFDLLVGGFPCQSFSIAGKRGGFDDTRGTLFFEIARIVREKQPRLLLLENVKGLLSHDKGATFYTIIATLDELGYDLQWQVLNSKNHGVPQNRERVFIIGHLRGTSRPQVFPLGEESQKDIRRTGEEVSYCIDSNYHKGTNTLKKSRRQLVGGSQGMRVYDTNGTSTTIASEAGGLGAKTGLYQTSDLKIRRLTPTECERLQGFPDGWTEGVSDTQRYKTLGNAVTVNVIRDICNKLL